MRIDATPLAQVHSRHVSASQRPGATQEPFKAANATVSAESANLAAPANASAQPAKSADGEKLTPAGLLAAQLRFQSMNSEEMNKGQTRAAEVINRNIERYRSHHGITVPAPAVDAPADTEPAAAGETAPAQQAAPATEPAGETAAAPATDPAITA